MASALLITIIVLFVAGTILPYFLIKKKLLAFLVSNLLALLVMGVLGYFIYLDFVDMREKLGTEPKLILGMHGAKVIGAVVVEGMDGEPVFLAEQQMAGISAEINSGSFDNLLGDYYKIIVVDSKSLQNVGPITLDTITITEGEAFSLLDKDDPVPLLLDIVTVQSDLNPEQMAMAKSFMEEQVRNQLGEPAQVKQMIFVLMFSKKLDAEGPPFLITEFKKGTILFQPETITFELLRLIPQFIVDRALENAGASQSPQN